MSDATKVPESLFAQLMAARGLDVADVAIECGVTRQAANEWRRGLTYPSARYAEDLTSLFGGVAVRRIYAAREARKRAVRQGRQGGRALRALRAAADVLDGRGLSVLAAMVRREAERDAGVDFGDLMAAEKRVMG